MECPHCRHENLAGSKRCIRCGKLLKGQGGMKTVRLTGGPPAAPTPPKPPPPPPEPDIGATPPTPFPFDKPADEPADEPLPDRPPKGRKRRKRFAPLDPTPPTPYPFQKPKDKPAAAGRAQGPPVTESVSGVRRRISPCDVCKGLFPADSLVDFGGGLVCEDCLERKPELLEKAAFKLKRVPRPAPGEEEPKGKGKEKGKKPRESGKSIDHDRETDETYVHRKTYISHYQSRTGRAPSSTTLHWPKCFRHPDRSTRDKCTKCGKPVCAMCIRRRGNLVFCPTCFGRSSQVLAVASSGKYQGFSGSFFEAVRESLFHPAIYFRNLPKSGSVIQPFLYSLLAWSLGSIVVLAVTWFFAFRDPGFDIGVLLEGLLEPLLLGSLCAGAGVAFLGWMPIHLLSTLLGGTASANAGFRLFCLSSGYHYLFFVPFVGWPLGLLSSFLIVPRAIGAVHGMGVIRSFFVYLVFMTLLAGGYFGVAQLVFTL